MVYTTYKNGDFDWFGGWFIFGFAHIVPVILCVSPDTPNSRHLPFPVPLVAGCTSTAPDKSRSEHVLRNMEIVWGKLSWYQVINIK